MCRYIYTKFNAIKYATMVKDALLFELETEQKLTLILWFLTVNIISFPYSIYVYKNKFVWNQNILSWLGMSTYSLFHIQIKFLYTSRVTFRNFSLLTKKLTTRRYARDWSIQHTHNAIAQREKQQEKNFIFRHLITCNTSFFVPKRTQLVPKCPGVGVRDPDRLELTTLMLRSSILGGFKALLSSSQCFMWTSFYKANSASSRLGLVFYPQSRCQEVVIFSGREAIRASVTCSL